MSLTHADIKRIRSLATRKGRDEAGLFVVEGEKMVEEALHQQRFPVEAVYRREDIGEAAMARISLLTTPSPALALLRQEDSFAPLGMTKEALGMTGGLYLALDDIRDPGNLGTILRIADWFGIDGILASPGTADRFNPKVVQATMGAIFRVRYQIAELSAALREIRRCGGRVHGTFLEGESLYSQAFEPWDKAPVVIVIGNEANGISEAVAGQVDARITIPRYGSGESLNAAVATAVTVAELRRRRG